MALPRWCRLAFLVVGALVALVFGAPFLVPLPGEASRSPQDLAPGATFVTLDGTTTRVEEAGPVDGPAVVLIHGFGGSTFSFRDTIEPLAAAGYRVVAFDLPGFGLSTKSFDRDLSHPRQADFAAELVTSLGITHATWLGHSMGGNVVAHVAERHPEMVDRVVFVAAAIAGPRDAARPPGRAPSVQRFSGPLLRFPPTRRIARIVLRSTLDPDRVAERFATAYGDASAVTPEAARGYTTVLELKDWDLALLAVTRDAPRNRLTRPISEVSVPTLVLWGERDSWVPLAAGHRLAASVAGARLDVLPGIGHLPMEEAPDEFNRLLIAFLNDR